ncbi:MAG: sulfite exporter TauE/SafE family protein [Spirochaetota bacterium]
MLILIAAVLILTISSLMTMTGRGGGNFYVPILIALGLPVHQAATTAQLILVASASAAMLIFQKHRSVDWKLALVIDPPTDLMAFLGGYYAHIFEETLLKVIFAGLLVVSAFFMLYPIKEHPPLQKKKPGFWPREYRGYHYVVNLWVALPITAATGLIAGMVGISGGSFKVPLMVLACGVPMRVAVGTSSVMVAVTAFTGFIGHTAGGDFNPYCAVPLAAAAVAGGLIGGKFSLKTKSRNLKRIFAFTTIAAAIFMGLNAWLS